MAIFYAIAKSIHNDYNRHYVIAFASRSVADEWWRAVETSCQTVATFSGVKRISPQFYVHDPNVSSINFTIINKKCAPEFLGKVSFSLLNDINGRVMSIIPSIDIRDHVSGQTLSGRFFIRYKGPVVRYWCVHNDMVCETTSSSRATPFVIWIAERRREYGDKIMIGTDEVHISIGERCDKTIYFHRESEDEDGDPKLRVYTVGGGPGWPPVPAKFIFSSFENGFIVGELPEPESGSYMYDKQIVGPILKAEGSGRRWELV